MVEQSFNELAVAAEEANSILTFQPASSNLLAASLVGLRDRIEAAARENVEAVIAGEQYSLTEIRAMVTVECLRLTGGLELTAVLLRAKYLRDIQTNNMLGDHPGGYASLQEMANDNGISIAELSQTLDLVNIIFPYIQQSLGISPAELWEKIGKSKLREMVPVLKAIITGEQSDTRTTQAAVESILDDTAATFLASDQGSPYRDIQDEGIPEAESRQLAEELNGIIRQQAVDRLITDGALLTTRQLRRTLRPERTPAIEASVIPMNGRGRLIAAVVSDDQYLMFHRLLGAHIDEQIFNLAADPRIRRQEANRIHELRLILQLMEG